MKILITGHLGYVGPALIRQLREDHPEATLVGVDAGWFSHCLSTTSPAPERLLNMQHFADVRELPPELFDGVDALIQLAAISNDPMGKAWEDLTHEVNCKAVIKNAEKARARGVRHCVFASSCSIYGFAEGGPRREQDELNPLTAYARSKVAAEQGLSQLATDNFTVSCLRFATACGFSDRLRLDLVLNDFVAGAIANRRIDILSDGTPWRPLIATEDMARALSWALSREADQGGDFLAVNAGSNRWNLQVKDLAQAVASALPGTEININTDAPPDKRSYQVSFDRFAELAPHHQPQVDLPTAIQGLISGLQAIGFKDGNFREGPLIRLNILRTHREQGLLDDTLHWRLEGCT